MKTRKEKIKNEDEERKERRKKKEERKKKKRKSGKKSKYHHKIHKEWNGYLKDFFPLPPEKEGSQ
jgi:hypothetical protein